MHARQRMAARLWLLVPLLSAASLGGARAQSTSDSWIITKTKIALITSEDLSDAADIHVDAVRGEVFLHGAVISDRMRSRAEEIVHAIPGVRAVRSSLEIASTRKAREARVPDWELRDAVERAFRGDPELAGSEIAIWAVDRGAVLIGGRARTMTEHLRALVVAGSVPGVRRVVSVVNCPDSLAGEEAGRAAASISGRVARLPGSEFSSPTSDMGITSEIKLRFLGDPRIPALDTRVDTRDGVVVLFGAVPTMEARAAAEAQAGTVAGVERIENELEVVTGQGHGKGQAAPAAEDERLELGVKKAITSEPGLWSDQIRVDVKDGIVHLTGSVDSQEDRLTASFAARAVEGVRAVEDDLRIEEDRSVLTL